MKKINSQKGFTLVEVMVALTILSMAGVSLYYVLSVNLTRAFFARNQLIASNLCQEGLEITRNVRDYDWFAENPFGTSIYQGTYIVSWDSDVLTSVNLEDVPFLKKNASGFFDYVSSQDSMFKRVVTITDVSGYEKKVLSEVTWRDRNRDYTVSAELHLFNWNQ